MKSLNTYNAESYYSRHNRKRLGLSPLFSFLPKILIDKIPKYDILRLSLTHKSVTLQRIKVFSMEVPLLWSSN